MYRTRPWTMRQYAGFGDARDDQRALPLPAVAGADRALGRVRSADPDGLRLGPSARARRGRAKWAWRSRAWPTWSALLDRLPLDRVTTSMTINATAPLLLAFYVAVADARGIDRSKLGGTVQNDVLKEYIARGTYIYPPAPSLRLVTDLFEFATREVPQWNTISVSGYHMREAGSTAVQELAFTLANALAVPRRRTRPRTRSRADRAAAVVLLQRAQPSVRGGREVPRRAQAVGRAAARAASACRDPEALKLRFHTQTAGSMLTAQQPLNNVVRVTVQGLAAVLGGTQSLHTNSLRRSPRPAGPRGGAARAAHAAGARARERRHRRRRPARRLVLGRAR